MAKKLCKMCDIDITGTRTQQKYCTPRCSHIYARYSKIIESPHQYTNLTKSAYLTIASQPCAYCDTQNDSVFPSKIDSRKTYIADNTLPACSQCRNAKRYALPGKDGIKLANILIEWANTLQEKLDAQQKTR